mmetsp:Transcript_41623/g.115880  ORF Transcript_41623/g.115880 Transcript_41623/m.115880 type:complete len:270 (-) Transcript_41623:180-989(-)
MSCSCAWSAFRMAKEKSLPMWGATPGGGGGGAASGKATGAGCVGASAPSASTSERGVPGGGNTGAWKGKGGTSGSLAPPHRQSTPPAAAISAPQASNAAWLGLNPPSHCGVAKGPGLRKSGEGCCACVGGNAGTALPSAAAAAAKAAPTSWPCSTSFNNEMRAVRLWMPCFRVSFSASKACCLSRHLATSSKSLPVDSLCLCCNWLTICRARVQSSCAFSATLASTFRSTASRSASMICWRSTLSPSWPRMCSTLSKATSRTLSAASEI